MANFCHSFLLAVVAIGNVRRFLLKDDLGFFPLFSPRIFSELYLFTLNECNQN